MSPSYLHRKRILFYRVHHVHVSTVAPNKQTKTLAPDRAFLVVMAFDGHCRYLHTLDATKNYTPYLQSVFVKNNIYVTIYVKDLTIILYLKVCFKCMSPCMLKCTCIKKGRKDCSITIRLLLHLT